MKKYITIDANTACANIAYSLSDVALIYPITPSSPMAETSDELASKNQKNIFGQTLMVRQMQSEAGVAGALHGSLCAGALSTTFTSSQGLLLMLPNMLKIAGELLPTVIHVSARALATHALSIFGDHSDVMAVRSSGFNMLASSSVQEAQDLALVSHIASLNSSLPFLHFFDGFRTSHEIQKIEAIDYDDIKKIFPYKAVEKFRQGRLDPCSPIQKGTAQNPDIFFQNREACNKFYDNVYTEVEKAMASVEQITNRHYAPMEYIGEKNAKVVIVAMGSSTETITETLEFLNKHSKEKFGLLKIRLYRPFNAQKFIELLPKSTKKIVVLDRTKESGAVGEPLYCDVASIVCQSGKNISVVGGRYGLGGKEFTPNCVKAVLDYAVSGKLKHNFTVGIDDDVTHLSLEVDPNFVLASNCYSMKFYGLGSDGTVGANKNTIKIIGEKTDKFVQGYFEYDSKKSGSMTISHLRVCDKEIKSSYLIENADFIAIHNYSFVARYDILQSLKTGGIVLLNTACDEESLGKDLPKHFVETLKQKNASLFIINASKIAENLGLGNKINTIMQSAFFAVTKILPEKVVMEELVTAIQKTYGRKGEAVVKMNVDAVVCGKTQFKKVDVSLYDGTRHKKSVTTKNKYYLEVIEPINSLKGNSLPVSAFSANGAVPTDTTKFEKRGISEKCPSWKSENCIQCGLCSLACPHSAIRAHLVKKENLSNAPSTLQHIKATMRDDEFVLSVSPLDCTGCGVCANVCPARNKALVMDNTKQCLESEKKNFDFLKTVPLEKHNYPAFTPKALQFEKPYFEYSYACPGCGETPHIRLLTTLFGKDMIIANATGCSSIYGGSAPACPYSKDSNGCGPAWANSLFEDNAEFGFGIYLGTKLEKQKMLSLIETVGVATLAEAKIFKQNGFLTETEKFAFIKKLEKQLNSSKLNKQTKEVIKQIIKNQNSLTKKSVWVIGGDGWAYDIGFGGLDHLLASGENINILVLDTEVYSNTGGQSSKATPSGAYAKFASSGKNLPKKNLGAIAMTYPDVYVAQIALGANPMQAINAFKEAQAHNGVSLIIAYSPCINHGIDMSKSYHEMKKAVDTGYWNLYRRKPKTAEAEEELILDSKPYLPYQDFLKGESRFTSLRKTNPLGMEKLFEQSENDAKLRQKLLQEKNKNNKV